MSAEHAKESLGDRLKRAMARAGVKNPAVADVADVDPATVSRWRNDKQTPSDEELERVAVYLRIPISWLKYGDTPLHTIGRAMGVPTTFDGPRREDPEVEFSRQIRERQKEVELELVRMGASDVEVSGFAQSIRGNPLLVAAFSGGAPAAQLTNAQVIELFEAAASGYKRIVAMLIAEREKEARRR